MLSIESTVESLCETILKTDAESWEIRNKAMLQLTELVVSHRDDEQSDLNEIFTTNVFRLLKEPVKNMILDLRSQQVRDTCHFLMRLAEVTGDRMKPFLRDSFSTVLEGVKIPHRVTSGYIDECIVHLIKHVTFKGAIVLFMHEIKESKAKNMRERCLEYINLILMHWDVTDKELDFFVDAIKLGLEDAAVRAREIARGAYLNMFNLYPERAEKIKAQLPKAQQLKLTRSEEEGMGSTAVSSSPNSSVNLGSSLNLGSSMGSAGLRSLANHLNGTSDSMELSTVLLDEPVARPASALHSSGHHASSGSGKGSIPSASHGAKHPHTQPTPLHHHHTASTASTTNKAHAHHSTVASSKHAATAAVEVATALQNAEVLPVPPKRKPVSAGYPKVQPSSSEALSTKFGKLHTSSGSINLLASSSGDAVPSRNSGAGSGAGAGGGEGLRPARGSMDSISEEASAPPQQQQQQQQAESAVEQAVLSIQARMRGTLSRRRSIVHNPFAALSASSPPPHTPLQQQENQPSHHPLHQQQDRVLTGATSYGSLSSGTSSGHTSSATRSTTASSAAATPAPATGVSFSAATKDRAVATSSSSSTAAASSALRTPAVKRTGLRGSQDTTATTSGLPAFSTSTSTAVYTASAAAAAAAASARKTSAASSSSSDATPAATSRSISATRSPRAASTSAAVPSSSARSRSASKTRSVSSGAVSSPDRFSVNSLRSSHGHEESALSLNSRVNVVTTKDGRLAGTVKFIGFTAFAAGTWFGVALDGAHGKNDGSVAGRRYFNCAPEHGLFVKEDAIERLASPSSEGVDAAMSTERDSVSECSQETPSVSRSNSASESASASSSEKKGGTITGLLKLKLAQMMEMLNHQLEIVVELEDEDRKRGAATGHSQRAAELHAEIVGITNKEQSLISAFKQHLTERLQHG